jgi:hypothetical protein
MSQERIDTTSRVGAWAWSMAHLLASAERELVAFVTAVNELFDSEQARRAAEDWIEELAGMDEPFESPVTDFRRVTIAAAVKLAGGDKGRLSRN